MIHYLRRLLFNFTFYFVMTVASYATVFSIGPWVETHYFPVVTSLKILKSEPGPTAGTTVVYASFRKVRDCEYLGLAWYRGKRDGEFERVSVILMRQDGDTSSPNRPVGYQKAGPWLIGVPFDEFRKNSFSDLLHRCHSFWSTRTEFYQ